MAQPFFNVTNTRYVMQISANEGVYILGLKCLPVTGFNLMQLRGLVIGVTSFAVLTLESAFGLSQRSYFGVTLAAASSFLVAVVIKFHFSEYEQVTCSVGIDAFIGLTIQYFSIFRFLFVKGVDIGVDSVERGHSYFVLYSVTGIQ